MGSFCRNRGSGILGGGANWVRFAFLGRRMVVAGMKLGSFRFFGVWPGWNWVRFAFLGFWRISATSVGVKYRGGAPLARDLSDGGFLGTVF